MKKTLIILPLAFIFVFTVLTSTSFADGHDFSNWGLGVSLTIDTGNRDRVDEANIVNGLVRVDKDNNAIPRMVLELHHFVWAWKNETIGLGPFAAIQPGGDDIIDAFGGGLMVGFRKNRETKLAFNVGIGIIVDPNTKVLGDGFAANLAPPPGETEVRFKETEQYGALILISTSF